MYASKNKTNGIESRQFKITVGAFNPAFNNRLDNWPKDQEYI